MNLNDYNNFVIAVTSEPSLDLEKMIDRLRELAKTGVNVPLFYTSASGMSAEAGEFMEIAKKALWQGKELTPDVQFHLKRELGDVIFYWSQACKSLGIDPHEVIDENVHKLESRYPGGKFEVKHSETRKENDL